MAQKNIKEKIKELVNVKQIDLSQAKVLEKLADEGYDVEPAMKGRISGFSKILLLEEYIRDGNEIGIKQLIKETKEEDDFRAAFLPELIKYDIKGKINDLLHNEKISIQQAKTLEQLVDEGYDVKPAMEGNIDGYSKIRKMIEYIKTGNEEGIQELIEKEK